MPEEHMTVEGIIQRAIRFEEDAYDFYTGASEMVRLPHVKDMLNELAGEEVKHKEKLENLLAGDTEQIIAAKQSQKIQDLKLADYLVGCVDDCHAAREEFLRFLQSHGQHSRERGCQGVVPAIGP